jgi:hypothetical protein
VTSKAAHATTAVVGSGTTTSAIRHS